MKICKKALFLALVLLLALALSACAGGPARISYEEYMNMTGKEQEEYYNQFPNVESFFEWYNNAKAEYEASRPNDGGEGGPDIEVGLLPGLGGTGDIPQHGGGAE